MNRLASSAFKIGCAATVTALGGGLLSGKLGRISEPSNSPSWSQQTSPISPMTAPDGQRADSALKLVCVHPEGAVGDKNQCEGIFNTLLEMLPKDQATVSRNFIPFNTKDSESLQRLPDQVAERIRGQARAVVVLASGSPSLLPLKTMPDARLESSGGEGDSNRVMVFSSHQYLPGTAQLEHLPDVMAYPKTAVTADAALLSERTTLVLGEGVPHNVNDTTIAADTVAYQQKGNPAIPTIDKNTVAIILPGDAPDAQAGGQQKRFTPEHAVALADRLIDRELDKRQGSAPIHFVVTNGPRTGKHDASGGVIEPQPHRTGKMDSVTAAFVDRVAQHKACQVTVLDFQFGQLPSAYKPLLGAFRDAGQNRGTFYVAGESVSMMHEVSSLLPNVALVEAESMNRGHYAEMEALIGRGSVVGVMLDGRDVGEPQVNPAPLVPAAVPIAEAIKRKLADPKGGPEEKGVAIVDCVEFADSLAPYWDL